MRNVNWEIAELSWFLYNTSLSPFSKIPTKTKNFHSVSDSNVEHLQTTTWDFLKLRRATWDRPPPSPPNPLGQGLLIQWVNKITSLGLIIFHQCSLNFIRLLPVVITSSVTTLLRGENDSKQSDEIQAITSVTTKEMETKISTPDTSEGVVLTPRLAVLEWTLGKCLRIIWIFPQNSFLKLWEFAMK